MFNAPPHTQGVGRDYWYGGPKETPGRVDLLGGRPAGTTHGTHGSSRPLKPTDPILTWCSLSYYQPLEGGREGQPGTLSVRPQGAADGVAAAP